MMLKSSSSLVLLVIWSVCIVRFIGQECTKRQVKRFFKATEKTFVVGCLASPDCMLDKLGWKAGGDLRDRARRFTQGES